MKKEIPFGIAIIPIIITVAVMMVTIVVLKQTPHVPLIIGTTVASIVAWRYGYKWNDLEEAMYKGIRLAFTCYRHYYSCWLNNWCLDWRWNRRNDDLLRFKTFNSITIFSFHYRHLFYRCISNW